MKLEDENVSEVSRIYSIVIALCVTASVLALVGLKVMITMITTI